MSDEEKEFLVGSRRPVRYGTTTSSHGSKQPRILRVVKHKVENSDTLQGIALKYDSPMVEIKRLNKLWSSDSIHLREFLDIPIFESFSSPTNSSAPSDILANGSVGQLRPGDSSFKLPASPAKLPNNPVVEQTSGETSIDQILSRIDSNIKSTAKNVKRLARNSSVETSLINSPTVSSRRLLDSASNSSIASLNEVGFELEDRSTSPSTLVVQINAQTGSSGTVATNGRKLRPATKERLQRLQEQFFEL